MTLGLRDRGRVEDDIIWKVKAKELIYLWAALRMNAIINGAAWKRID